MHATQKLKKCTPIACFKKMQCTVFELHIVRCITETLNLLPLHLLNIAQCASFKNHSVYLGGQLRVEQFVAMLVEGLDRGRLTRIRLQSSPFFAPNTVRDLEYSENGNQRQNEGRGDLPTPAGGTSAWGEVVRGVANTWCFSRTCIKSYILYRTPATRS